jgi:hypothetical protein
LNKVDGEFTNCGASPAEVQQLREENLRLRSLLSANGIQIPNTETLSGDSSEVSNSATKARTPGVGTAEQRIALFRSLFRGREDVFVIRWQNDDGRSGYMPKADRDWKSYLSAKEEDRKKVDRLTRKYRPLTDDVVREHLNWRAYGRTLFTSTGRDLLGSGGQF